MKSESRSSREWALPFAAVFLILFSVFVGLYSNARIEVSRLKASAEAPAKTVQSQEGTSTAQSQAIDSKSIEKEMDRILTEVSGENDLKKVAWVIARPNGVWIRLQARDLYLQDREAPNVKYQKLILEIGRMLLQANREVRIEGHDFSAYADPWALSSKRASWVMRKWMGELHFPSKSLSLAGYGDSRPLNDQEASSDTRLEFAVFF